MYHNVWINRRMISVLAAAAALVVFRAAAAPAATDPAVKCQRTIWKAAGKFEQDKMKALQKCEDNKLKGKLAPTAVCATEAGAAISAAQSAMEGSINKDCAGLTPASFKFGTVCPDLVNVGCNTPITDVASVVTCLTCVVGGGVDQLNALYYGSLTAPGGDKNLEKCKQTLGKETAGFFATKSKALQGCQDKVISGASGGPCPDGKARATIDKAKSKAIAKINNACGSFSTEQIGAPADCPAVESQGVGTKCGGTITSTTALTDCVACASQFTSLCTDCSHCGNGVNNAVTGLPVVDFNTGETCDDGDFIDSNDCPKTCEIRKCTGSGKTQKVNVTFNGSNVAGLTVFLRYGENAAVIPGRANEQTVLDRVTNLPGSAFAAINDLDFALRVVAISDSTLPAGQLFTVEFDTCKKPKFNVSDLECVVEDASDSNFNSVAGVTCQAAFAK